MAVNVRIARTYFEYSSGLKSDRLNSQGKMCQLISRIQKSSTFIKILKSGLAWIELLSPNVSIYDHAKLVRKEIADMNSPLLITKYAQSVCKFGRNIGCLKTELSNAKENNKSNKKISKLIKKALIDLNQFLYKTLKLIGFLKKDIIYIFKNITR